MHEKRHSACSSIENSKFVDEKTVFFRKSIPKSHFILCVRYVKFIWRSHKMKVYFARTTKGKYISSMIFSIGMHGLVGK